MKITMPYLKSLIAETSNNKSISDSIVDLVSGGLDQDEAITKYLNDNPKSNEHDVALALKDFPVSNTADAAIMNETISNMNPRSLFSIIQEEMEAVVSPERPKKLKFNKSQLVKIIQEETSKFVEGFTYMGRDKDGNTVKRDTADPKKKKKKDDWYDEMNSWTKKKKSVKKEDASDETFEMVDAILNVMQPQEAFENLVQAMGRDNARELLGYIIQQYEIPYGDNHFSGNDEEY